MSWLPKFVDADGRLLVVGVAAINDEGAILFGKRGDTGEWCLPGGHMDWGEHPPIAAVRELYEETGLKAKEIHFLGHGDVAGKSTNKIRVYCYKALVGSGKAHPYNDPDQEFKEFRWVPHPMLGLPKDIGDNLKNGADDIVLKFLGIQRGVIETADVLAHDVPVVYNTLLQSEKDMLEKTALLAGSILAASVLAPSPVANEPPPLSPAEMARTSNMGEISQEIPIPSIAWTNAGLSTHLESISYLESGAGKYLNHIPSKRGDFYSDFGLLGFKPSTAYERYILNPQLQARFPHLNHPDAFLQEFTHNQEFYKACAKTHWHHLLKIAGQNPDHAAYAWRWGEQKMRDAAPDDIVNDPYVQRFHALQEALIQKHELSKEMMMRQTKQPKAKKSKTAAATHPKQQNLIALHNIHPEGLKHAHELGGLAAPSLAVSHKDHPLTNFGSISLVGGHDLVDPAAGVPVYESDVYSPRHPRSRYNINAKPLEKLKAELAPHHDSSGNYHGIMDEELQRGGTDALSHRGVRIPMGMAYLKSKGKLPDKLPMTAVGTRYPWSGQPEMKAFFAEHGKDINARPGEPYWDKFSHAVKESIHSWAHDPTVSDDPEMANYLKDIHGKETMDENGKVHFGKGDHIMRDHDKHGKQTHDTHAIEDMVDKELAKPEHKEEFKKWAHQKIAPVLGSAYIPKFTSGGNERRVPYTLDNVLKEVKGRLRGGEDFNYGLGNARAMGTKQLRSLDQIRNAQSKIVPKEQFESAKKDLDDRFGTLAEDLKHYHPLGGNFGTLGALATAVGESYKRGGDVRHALEQNGFTNVPQDTVNAVHEFSKHLLAMPTEYFEAKPQRIVHLNEFKGAAVPHNVDPKVLEILAHHNVPVEKYHHTGNELPDKEARKRAVSRLARRGNLMLAELSKFQTPPRFPKLGLKETHDTPIIDNRKDYTNRGRFAAGQMARDLFPDADPQNRAKESQIAAKRITGNKKIHGFNMSPGGGAVKSGKLIDPKSGINPKTGKEYPVYNTKGVIASKMHEDLHNKFGEVERKYGPDALHHLRNNLFNALPKSYQSLLRTHLQIAAPSYNNEEPDVKIEERFTHLMNYLNDPHIRDRFHKGLSHGDGARRKYSTAMKRAHQFLSAASEMADESWLKPKFG